MSQDVMSKFYTILNLPLHEKLQELTHIIDQSSPNKELQAFFPQLISNIFSATSFNNGWGLRTVTADTHRYEYMLLMSFLEPQGPLFRLCYKLLSDPQLKYNIPLDVLPQDLQITLERGRCPQFYADMINMDSRAINVVALALNPFDYYIFNFALHLVNNNQNKGCWENWNSVYFALACDYLMHFLPADPNITVLPQIPNYTGKVLMAAPLQAANRPLYSPSLLLIPDIFGMNTQHASSQNQSRNEIWRSETVLQVFVDVWMSEEEVGPRNIDPYKRNSAGLTSSPERVRTVRVLVKHLHTYSAKHFCDPATRASALRTYARQILCARAYRYVKHLVTTWPLDASFRLVLELWLSLIQPWRYTDEGINQDRFPNNNQNQEEGNASILDASYTQFIAENFPSYICILHLVLPRFMRLDLTAYKNAVMLFRLGKVFSQQHLIPILRDLEQGITENGHGLYYNPDTSWNNSSFDTSLTNNNNSMSTNKWVAVAKQSLSELNLATDFQYSPIWTENRRQFMNEFVQNIFTAKAAAETIVHEHTQRLNQQNQGIWASIKHWLMIGTYCEDELLLEECKKVPTYLNASVHQFSVVFGLNERNLVPPEASLHDTGLDQSSFGNSTSFPFSVTNKLRSKSTTVSYMGDPDLMPITSYESTILVRILYQLASRLNEIYHEEFNNLWNKDDFQGCVAREILQKPCTIQTYLKDIYNHKSIVSQNLPARLSLRRLGSYACVVWLTLGYILFRSLSYNGAFYLSFLITIWAVFVLTKAALKSLKLVRS